MHYLCTEHDYRGSVWAEVCQILTQLKFGYSPGIKKGCWLAGGSEVRRKQAMKEFWREQRKRCPKEEPRSVVEGLKWKHGWHPLEEMNIWEQGETAMRNRRVSGMGCMFGFEGRDQWYPRILGICHPVWSRTLWRHFELCVARLSCEIPHLAAQDSEAWTLCPQAQNHWFNIGH